MDTKDQLAEWRSVIVGMGQVSTAPPRWVLPGFLPPGMTLVSAQPKVGKTTLMMLMLHLLLEGKQYISGNHVIGPPQAKGSCFYIPYEQKNGRLRYMYEERIGKLKLANSYSNFLFPKEAWNWQVDKPSHDEDLLLFMKEVRPTVVVIDPWIYAHSGDENDPQSIRPLVPLKNQAEASGTSLVVVHHNSKRSDVDGFDKIRGTSALWGMADAGHIISRDARTPGKLLIKSEFKDFESVEWGWELPK